MGPPFAESVEGAGGGPQAKASFEDFDGDGGDGTQKTGLKLLRDLLGLRSGIGEDEECRTAAGEVDGEFEQGGGAVADFGECRGDVEGSGLEVVDQEGIKLAGGGDGAGLPVG